MKGLYMLSMLILLSACSLKETIDSLELANDAEPLAENINQEEEDNWQFLGIYAGEKEEDYNQQLSYELYLWQLDNKYQGYIYYLWYVTDFNYNEYHSVVSGKPKGEHIILKGKFDSEPVVITIHDSIRQELHISLRYPTNSNAFVNNLKLSLDKEKQKSFLTDMNGENTMNHILDSLSNRIMEHKGY